MYPRDKPEINACAFVTNPAIVTRAGSIFAVVIINKEVIQPGAYLRQEGTNQPATGSFGHWGKVTFYWNRGILYPLRTLLFILHLKNKELRITNIRSSWLSFIRFNALTLSIISITPDNTPQILYQYLSNDFISSHRQTSNDYQFQTVK